MLSTPLKASMNHESLTIPVRPAVLKYLQVKLLLVSGSAFKLTKKGPVGRMLYHLLRTPQSDRQYIIDPVQYSATLPIHISQHLFWLNGCRHLTPQGIHDFNRQIEDLIESEFLTCMEVLASHGLPVQPKAAALRFMERYGFVDEDFTPDALIKAYQRNRKPRNSAGLASNYIPNCPAARVAA